MYGAEWLADCTEQVIPRNVTNYFIKLNTKGWMKWKMEGYEDKYEVSWEFWYRDIQILSQNGDEDNACIV